MSSMHISYGIAEVSNPLQTRPSAIETGELRAFQIAGQWRVTEEALVEVMRSDSRPSTADRQVEDDQVKNIAMRKDVEIRKGKKDTDSQAVKRAKEWAWERLREVAPDLSPHLPDSKFTANGKQGILCAATVHEPGKPSTYFFGFAEQSLKTGRPTFIVAVVAPRHQSERRAFIIPYEKYKEAIDGWSLGKNGQKTFHIEESGRHYLYGARMQAVDIEEHLNAFALLR